MSTFNPKNSQAEEVNLGFLRIPQQTLLQLSVGPLLLALLGGRAAAQLVQAIGEASEEIFRGERLPVLKGQPEEAPAAALSKLSFPLETESDSSSESC